MFFSFSSQSVAAGNLKIIPRQTWGADESLRVWNPDTVIKDKVDYVNPCKTIEEKYENEFRLSKIQEYTPDGQSLIWPLQYVKKIEKFSIHHTDSDLRDMNNDAVMDGRDYSAMVRAIYNYHAVSRGWGDIGYNYLIDPLGNIYEGRYGGDKVIGAHSLCYNHSVLGIAILGDYENEKIPEPAMKSLINLIASKSKTYGIDPGKSSVFKGKNLANVFGHKDVRATSCPGKVFYGSLPKIRSRAALGMQNFSENTLAVSEYDYNAELISDLKKLSVNPGESKSVVLKFKNTGKKTWDKSTWMHVALNNDANARIVPAVEGKAFVASDLQEDSVAPGKTGTFTVEAEGGFKPGHYAFQLSPVVNGRYKISRASEYLSFQVPEPDYDYEVVRHEFPSGTVYEGQQFTSTLTLKNTGNVTWKNYGKSSITLGASSPKDRASIFVKDNPFRLGYLIDSEVAPGETGQFSLNLNIPEDREDEVIERFTPVIENVGWLADKALGFKVNIKKPKHLAKSVKVDRLGFMYPGERRFVQVEIENRGDLAWDASTVETTLLGRGMKIFKRMLLPEEAVQPGKKMKIGFWVEAPMEAGQHSVYLRSRFNKKPIRGAVARYIVEVPETSLKAEKTVQESAVALELNQTEELTVSFKNTGTAVWKKKGPNAVHLGTASPRDRESDLFVKSNWIDPFRAAEMEEDQVRPGETGTFKFKVQSDSAGRFTENFQLVMEGVGWIAGGSVRWNVAVSKDAPTASKPSVNQAASILSASDSEPGKNEERPFRVRLSHEASTATLTANKPFLAFNEKDQVIFNLSAGKEVSVKRLAGGFQVKSGSLTKNAKAVRLMPKQKDGIVEILSMERRPAWNDELNDNRFRGIVEMRIVDGQVAYINELILEDYLRGLAEVSNGDHPEKQKTIAVLARTYARFYMKDDNRKFPSLPYDGSDDPAVFQRYLGYGVEVRSPNFVKAVEETKGMVVTYQDELIKTPYFNQSDGRTRSAKEVWNWDHTPYLKSVADPWCDGLELKGHGVGLSGCGATAQAEEGKGFKEIIKYYYSGVAVEKLE